MKYSLISVDFYILRIVLYIDSMTYFRWSCRKDLSVSGPAVLSVSIPSGFILDESQRKSLINSGSNVWTEGSEIIFFFEKVMIYKCHHHRNDLQIQIVLSIYQYYSNLQLTTDFTCVNFTLLRNFPVANLSPYIPIKIYDWYSPGKKN